MADSVKLPIEFQVIKSDDVKAYLKDLKAKIANFNKFAKDEAMPKQAQSIHKATAALATYEKRLESLDMRKKDSKVAALSLIAGINDEVKALEKEILTYKTVLETVKATKLEKNRRADFREQFGKDFIDGEVYIPIKFTVDEDNAVKDFIETTTARAQEISEAISGKSFDNSKEVHASIDAVNQYVEAIDAARQKMVELRDASEKARERAEKLKGMNAADYGMSKEDFGVLVNQATKDATKAREKYILQGTELQQTMQATAAAASQEMNSIEELAGSYAKSSQSMEQSTVTMKGLLHRLAESQAEASKASQQQEFFDKYQLDTVQQSLRQINDMMEQYENAVNRQYRKGDKFVTVDPEATAALASISGQIEAIIDELIESGEYFEKLEALITDGSIEEVLEREGHSFEYFGEEIQGVSNDVSEYSKELQELLYYYHILARDASVTAKEIKNGRVTWASNERPIDAKTKDAQYTQEKEAAEAKAKAEEEARIAKEKADKAAAEATKAQIKRLHDEEAAIKRSTAQYYYKLRSLKMLGFVFRSVDSTVTKFGKTSFNVATKALSAYSKLIPGISALRKAFDGANKSQRKFNAESKKTIKNNTLMNMSLKDLIKLILQYGFGIRSIYMLFRKLRSAVVDGLKEMSKMFDDVNTSMSSIVTSFAQLKAAFTSIFEPIVHVLAPALERLSAAFTELSYKAASFIAALTGQSMVYKAVRSQIDYAESLDKTAKNAKKAKQELSGLDKLNVINSKNDDDDNTGLAWEKVPIDDRMKEWADKFKEFLRKLFAPIKAAWKKWGAWVKASFKKMLNELLGLGKAIADDFWKVWAEPETQKIFENIFHIMGDIALIVANLAINFRNAWKHNKNGYRILKAIRDIILIITNSLVRMADYTVEWARNLNFIPLLDAIADTLEQRIVPAVEKIMGLVETLYEQIFLNIVKKFIEGGLPRLVTMLGKVVEIVGIIADKINFALKSGSNGINIINKISELLDIVASHIDSALDKTKEWAEQLDFRPLLKGIKDFLDEIQPAVDAIAYAAERLWTDVLLPFWSYLVEDGGPKLLDILGKIFGEYNEETGFGVDWEHFKTVIDELIPSLEKFLKLSWETLLQIIEDLGKAFDDFVNSESLDTIIKKFGEWVEKTDPETLATKIEKFAKAIIELKIGLDLVSKFLLPVVIGFMTILNVVNQFVMGKKLAIISAELATLTGEGSTTAGLSGVATMMGKVAGEAKTLGYILPDMAKVFSGSSPLVGGLSAVAGAFMSLSGGFDMMENGFSMGAELATVLGGILTTVGLIVAGIAAWPAVIAGAVVVIIANLGAFGDDLLKFVTSTMTDFINKVGEFFHNIGFYIGAFIHEAVEKLGELLSDALENMSKPENWIEFGINILKGILAIFLLPFRLLEMIGTAIANLLAGFIEGLCTGFDMHSPSKAMEPYGENILGGILEGIIAAIKGIGTWINENIVIPMLDGVKSAFGIVGGVASKFKEIGGNLINGLKEGISSGWDAAKSTITDIWNKVTHSAEEEYEVNSPSKVFTDIGGYIMAGLDKGLADNIRIIITTVTTLLKDLLTVFSSALNANTLADAGNILVTGLSDAISKAWNSLTSMVTNNINKLIQNFKSKLSPSALVSAGKNLINGLKNGLMSGLSSALSAVSNICSQITSRVRSAFQIHSPSKVFEDIGELLMKGLVVGVDDGSEDVTDTFENLFDSDAMIDSFYDRFLSKMSELTTSVATLFDEMSLHISDVMNNLSNLAAMQNFNDQLASVSKIRIPSIAKGYSLPANAEFKKDKTTSTEIDLSDLPNIIKDAVIEAITSTTDLQTDDETTIINIDGKEIFRAVKSENTKYKKMHGKSAFA